MSLGIKALCQQAYIWLLKVDPLNPKTAILSNCSSSDGVRKEKWSRPWKHDLEEEQALKDVYIKYISIDQKFVSETIMGCWEFAKNCFLENVDCRIRQSDTNWKITECSSLCRPDWPGGMLRPWVSQQCQDPPVSLWLVIEHTVFHHVASMVAKKPHT